MILRGSKHIQYKRFLITPITQQKTTIFRANLVSKIAGVGISAMNYNSTVI